ncbi:PREDICTED: syntaxin-16-like isoform X1 [Branchiostoma belcheri]|uniref:Syntaxin-16 n=1 Tax=Branchiostoma belcheri TaxID=7741 RepID=A0A6P4ZG90_BRABE|nr:PREDICTED: syntaxin-16-like isoform X1 [Branchiostoma belcheri]
MATRSLTEIFILMRNNAAQNRHMFAEQVSTRSADDVSVPDDRMALVSGISTDPDAAIGVHKSSFPPDWVDGVEDVSYEITKIRQKMKELSVLHDKQMNRPTLDDSMEEEHAIEIITQEITQMFHRCQRAIQNIGNKSRYASTQEQRVTKNIMSSHASNLQDLSIQFRKGQSAYLRRLKNREERSRQFFEPGITSGSSLMTEEEVAVDELYDRGFTPAQMQMVDENSEVVEEREREINKIVQSISDLNEIFRDLAQIVVEQGTVLDRIDYNIEQTATKVDSGLQQLQKAEKYQKKNRKMLLILVLAVIVIIMFIILVATKFR